MNGRKKLLTNEKEITRNNVIEVLFELETDIAANVLEIQKLYDYYRGKQAIQSKTKETRPEINNIVTENIAYEIIQFKKGYIFGEPIQYIRRGEDESLTNKINILNDHMLDIDKGALDDELAEWLLISGVGYRYIYADDPFGMVTLDPRNTFVIRRNDIKKSIIAAVTFSDQILTEPRIYSVYTPSRYFEIQNGQIIKETENMLGYIPIIEYTTGNARLGSFEPVLELMDAINTIQSNRVDDVVQAVNSILLIYGADMSEETYQRMNEWKTLVLPNGTDAKYITASLQQGDTQTLTDGMYQTILNIVGMPNRNGGSSTSDTGAAVQLRDGWESAEAGAKIIEKVFKKSEREMLRVILHILRETTETDLDVTDLDIKFARRYTDNILTKTQALTQLLNAGIDPGVAIATCGLWNDPTDVEIQSRPYLAKWEIEDVRGNGQDTDTPQEENESELFEDTDTQL